MKSVLMVCLGNICRSPLAEGILRHKLLVEGIKDITVDSAGTSNYHVGDPPDSRTIENAKIHGIDISKLRGRQFTRTDFDRFDRIYVMDSSNYKDVITLARNNSDRQKVELLLNVKWPGKNSAVPDPYYSEGDGFENVFQLIEQACNEIVKSVVNIQ